MRNAKRIVAFSPEDLAARRARGEDRTDWPRVAATTDAEVESAVAADPDEAGMQVDWNRATLRMPERKRSMTIRLDADVLAYFQGMGRGYQTRINAVLRAYMNRDGG